MTTQTPELEQKLQIEKTDQKKKGRPVSAERLGKENKQINLIVDAFGGNTKMAQALNTYPALISQWKIRRSIPKSWWMQIEDAASKQNIPLTREDIMKADLR